MNALHTMLAAGFIQAEPVLGETFTYLTNTFIGFFTPADEKLLMEIMGYLDESDTICVVSTAQFTSPPAPPEVKTTLVRNGDTYSIRGIKSDLSAYILALKKIST
jgi:hypothetical protein